MAYAGAPCTEWHGPPGAAFHHTGLLQTCTSRYICTTAFCLVLPLLKPLLFLAFRNGLDDGSEREPQPSVDGATRYLWKVTLSTASRKCFSELHVCTLHRELGPRNRPRHPPVAQGGHTFYRGEEGSLREEVSPACAALFTRRESPRLHCVFDIVCAILK